MKNLILLLFTLLLPGCATGCRDACILGFGPGNPIFDRAGDYYNSQDPCQIKQYSSATGQRLKPEGYSLNDIPSWCTVSHTRRTQRYTVYDRNGHRVYTIR